MRTIKMICTDIDGTLLNNAHNISLKTKETVRKINEKNIPFILVSARMPDAMVDIHKELELTTPMICYSGALIVEKSPMDQQRCQVIGGNALKTSTVRHVYRLVKENVRKTAVLLYTEKNWFVEDCNNEAVLEESHITGVKPVITSFKDLLDDQHKIYKILCIGPEHEVAQLEEKLKETFPQLAIDRSKSTYLEIMAPHTTKAITMKWLADRFKIDMEEVMAVGDNYNDAEMIQAAGLGIAMGNAPKDIKKVADEVTLSNDKDGLAHVINKYFSF